MAAYRNRNKTWGTRIVTMALAGALLASGIPAFAAGQNSSTPAAQLANTQADTDTGTEKAKDGVCVTFDPQDEHAYFIGGASVSGVPIAVGESFVGYSTYPSDLPKGYMPIPYTTDTTKAFDGWYYKDSNGIEHELTPGTKIAKEMSVYAKWSSKEALLAWNIAGKTPIVTHEKLGSTIQTPPIDTPDIESSKSDWQPTVRWWASAQQMLYPAQQITVTGADAFHGITSASPAAWRIPMQARIVPSAETHTIKYDGKTHYQHYFEVEQRDESGEWEKVDPAHINVKYTGKPIKGKNAGTYTVTPKVEDFQITSVVNYLDPYVGEEYKLVSVAPVSLTIAPREVTITSRSASQKTGPVISHEATSTGDDFLPGETPTLTFTGKQEAEGTSDNTFTYAFKDAETAQNYKINRVFGKLTVGEDAVASDDHGNKDIHTGSENVKEDDRHDAGNQSDGSAEGDQTTGQETTEESTDGTKENGAPQSGQILEPAQQSDSTSKAPASQSTGTPENGNQDDNPKTEDITQNTATESSDTASITSSDSGANQAQAASADVGSQPQTGDTSVRAELAALLSGFGCMILALFGRKKKPAAK